MMTRSALVVFLVLSGTTAQAKLQMVSIQAAYGPVGPERPSLVYYPGDEIVFRYVLTGVQMNAKGEVDVDISLQVTDAAGQILLYNASPAKAVAALGGGCLPGTARATLNDTLPPGAYRLRVKA